MSENRLPSFNDFSPAILREDLRKCLQHVVNFEGDDEALIEAWADEYFEGKTNKRSSSNIPVTLKSTGLSTGARPIKLSDVGMSVLAAASAIEAAKVFCAHIIKNKNGDKLLAAIHVLGKRSIAISKTSLQEELKAQGIVGLSTNTTDHSTLKNWMVFAGIVTEDGNIDEPYLKKNFRAINI